MKIKLPLDTPINFAKNELSSELKKNKLPTNLSTNFQKILLPTNLNY